MKKLIAVLLALALCFGMAACGTPSPTEVTDDFLKAVQSQDADSMKALYEGNDVNFLDKASKGDTSQGIEKTLTDEVLPKLLEFEYTLSNEKIDGDKATVDVSIKTYNLGDAFSNFMSSYFVEAFSMAMSGASDKKIEEKSVEVFSKEIKNMEFKYEKTVPLSLSKKDGKWVVDEFKDDSKFLNAFTGGMIDAVKELTDAFKFD